MSQQRVIVSTSTLIIAVVIGLLLVLLWQLRSLIVVLMIALVLAAALAPIIDKAENLNIPRWLAVLLVYLGLIAGLTGVGILIGPAVVEQIQSLFRRLPAYLAVLESLSDNLEERLGLTNSFIGDLFDSQTVLNWLIGSSRQLLVRSYGVTRGIVGGAINVFLVLLISIYMLSGANKLIDSLVSLFPHPWNRRLKAQVTPVSQRMGGYIQGRVLVSIILGIAVSIGLRILGLSEFALGLGAIAAVTNLIPFFGPILGAIPALIVALAQGGWLFLWVLLLFVIIQNVETYLLDPLLVGNTVKVYPLYQLLAVLGGAQVLGIVGAVIVPPWVAGASVLLNNLYLRPKKISEQQAIEPDAPETNNDSSKNGI